MTVSAAFAATAATAATAAFTMTFAIATAVLAMTTAAFTRHRLDQLRHFFLRGLAVSQHLTDKVQRTTGQWMVEVDGHSIRSYFHDTTIEVISSLILQHQNGIGIDVLGVKLTIYLEDMLVDALHQIVVAGTKSLLRSQLKVETVANSQIHDLTLEVFQHIAHTTDESSGLGLFGHLDKHFLSIRDIIELIRNAYQLVTLVFAHYNTILLIICCSSAKVVLFS